MSKTHSPWLVSFGPPDGGDGKTTSAKKSGSGAAASRVVVEIPKDHDWIAADEQAADAAALASPRSDVSGGESLGVASGDLGASSGADAGGLGAASGAGVGRPSGSGGGGIGGGRPIIRSIGPCRNPSGPIGPIVRSIHFVSVRSFRSFVHYTPSTLQLQPRLNSSPATRGKKAPLAAKGCPTAQSATRA